MTFIATLLIYQVSGDPFVATYNYILHLNFLSETRLLMFHYITLMKTKNHSLKLNCKECLECSLGTLMPF